MADDPSRQVEIEIALRDTASSVLKDISKNIDEISRKLVETGRKGADAFEKIKRGSSETGEGTKKAGEHVSSLTDHMGKLGQALHGPLGLAAGFAGLAISVERFFAHAARGRLQLQLMTADIGLSKEAISEMQQVLSRKGIIDPAEQKRIITQFGGDAMDLKTRGVYSEFWQRLQKFDPKFAQSFKQSVDRGDIKEAFDKTKNMYADLIKAGRPDLAHYFATQTMHMTASTLENWDEFAKGLVKVRELGEREAKAAARFAADAAATAQSEINTTLDSIMRKMLQYEKVVEKTGNTIDETMKKVPVPGSQEATPNATVKGRFPGPEEFKGQSGGSGGGNIPRITIPARPRPQSSSDDGATLPAGARPTGFTTLREINTTEKDTNKALLEIRDLLMMDEVPDAGGAARGTTFRRGIRSGQRGPGGQSGSGPQSSVGTSGALGGTVHGHPVDAYGGLTGTELVDPVTASSLGGGVGGSSARFGPNMHEGVDIMAPENSPVVSPRAGTIVSAGNGDGYGNQTITVDHGDGTFTRILHIRGVGGFQKGDKVTAGQPIGRSGYANAPHIHFEMWKGKVGRGGTLINPRALYGWDKNNLPQAGRTTQGKGPSGLPITPPALPPAIGPSSSAGSRTVRASTYDDAVTASGLPRNVPGIALPDKSTLGQWFWVTDSNTGKRILAKQVDVGPATWTKRGVDINKPLAERFGYTSSNFPTDTKFTVEPMDKELGKTGAGGPTSQRNGRVNATINFGKRAGQKHAEQQPFRPLKLSTGRQNESVHAGSVLPGDMEHSRWTV